MARETWVQSQVESYQRLKKWYLMPPCLTLSIIRYGSRVKWSNPGKGVAPSPTPWCSKLSKREPSGHPRLWSPTYLLTIRRQAITKQYFSGVSRCFRGTVSRKPLKSWPNVTFKLLILFKFFLMCLCVCACVCVRVCVCVCLCVGLCV